MANPQVAIAPTHEPLTLDELKLDQRIELDNSDDDVFLYGAIQAATVRAENFLDRKLVTQTLDFFVDTFPAKDFIRLPGGRLASITSLKYTDSDDSETTWAASNYFASVTSEPGRLNLAYNISWPSVTLKPRDAIVVRYIVGYGTGDQVPANIRKGILYAAGHYWNNRQDVVVDQGFTAIKVPHAAELLWWPDRIVPVPKT